jgi:hypothetical protein
VSASAPNPVFTPHAGAPPLIAATTAAAGFHPGRHAGAELGARFPAGDIRYIRYGQSVATDDDRLRG